MMTTKRGQVVSTSRHSRVTSAVRSVRAGLAAATLLAVAAPAVPAGSAAPAPPLVAYYRAAGVKVSGAGGGTVATFDYFQSFSVQGGVFAGTTGLDHRAVVAYRLPAGTQRFRISGALQPTVLNDAGRVAFWGTGGRDPQNNSVWMREPGGATRRIVQFSNGGGLPGHSSGFGGDGTILSTSFDATGSMLGLAEGNDVDLFAYDVFTVDTATREFTRLTSDHRSRRPTVSPNGRFVVYDKEIRDCGAPYMRASQLVIARADASWRHHVTKASCKRWLSGARFVAPGEVVAFVYERTAPGVYATDLARVDLSSGTWHRMTWTGDVTYFSADPIHHLVAYSRDGAHGFRVRDLVGGGTTVFGAGALPHLSGDHGTL